MKILEKKQKTNVGQTRKNDARRKTHEGKMIKEKMMIEKRKNLERKEAYKIVFFWVKKENRKRKFNRSLQRFKKCEERLSVEKTKGQSKSNEKIKKGEKKVKETGKHGGTNKKRTSG